MSWVTQGVGPRGIHWRALPSGRAATFEAWRGGRDAAPRLWRGWWGSAAKQALGGFGGPVGRAFLAEGLVCPQLGVPGAESGLSPRRGLRSWTRAGVLPPASVGRCVTQPLAFSMTCHPGIAGSPRGGWACPSPLSSCRGHVYSELKAGIHISLPRLRSVLNSAGEVQGL